MKGLAELTYEQVAKLERPVAIVPVGSVEPHGPHLPLDTDTLISEICAARCRDGARQRRESRPSSRLRFRTA